MRSEEELRRYYASAYYSGQNEDKIARLPQDITNARQNTILEVKRYRMAGVFLEIGCGYGSTLAAARDEGYRVVGIEPSAPARKYAREHLQLDVREGSLEACRLEPDSFDVVYAWHVIEHVPDLARFLREVHRILRPDGVFYFGTENYRCLANRFSRAQHLLGGSLPGLDTAPEHTFLLTPNIVKRMFPRFGFRVAMARAFQPTHKRERFFASAKHGSALKRAIKAAVLAGVYGASVAVPPWGGHMKAALLKR